MSLVATDAATSLTIANVYARIAARLLAATAAQATAERQADSTSFFAHSYSVVKRNGKRQYKLDGRRPARKRR